MRKNQTRLAALEAEKRAASQVVHSIGYHEGDTPEEKAANREAALEAYGKDRIGPDDLLIQRVFVAPKVDGNGKMIRRAGREAA